MNWWPEFLNLLRGVEAPEAVEAQAEELREKYSLHVSEAFKERLNAFEAARVLNSPQTPNFRTTIYQPPKGVAPAAHVLAMDTAVNNAYGDSITQLQTLGFPGYPFLSELTQISEYRDLGERVAAEMTRKWIKIRNTGDEDRAEVIHKLDAALRKHCVRDLFRDAAIRDAWFGRCQLFMNFGDDSGDELKTPLLLNKYKVPKDSFRGFKLVEPISTYPAAYNADNPLKSDFYKPSAWFVYGQQVHVSRMLTFISRPLPDLLKPIYNFGGMSLSQLAIPYVDYWLTTRTNVGEIIRNFRTTVFKTDLSDVFSDHSTGEGIFSRLAIFTKMRSNFGVFAVDKTREEEISELNTPLSGLKELQAAAQEHIAVVAKTPLVVLLGVSPTGLNSSSEGEMRVFNDYIHSQQELLFRAPLETIFKVFMLDLFGEIYEDITFDFEPLVELTDTDHATIRKIDADTGAVLIQSGVISPEEERQRITADPTSGYNNLDASAVPEPPDDLGDPQLSSLMGE